MIFADHIAMDIVTACDEEAKLPQQERQQRRRRRVTKMMEIAQTHGDTIFTPRHINQVYAILAPGPEPAETADSFLCRQQQKKRKSNGGDKKQNNKYIPKYILDMVPPPWIHQ